MKACSNFVFDRSRPLAMKCAGKYRKLCPHQKTTHCSSIPVPEQCILRHLAQLPGNLESSISMLQFHPASVFLISDCFKSKRPRQCQLYNFLKPGQGVRSKFSEKYFSIVRTLKWTYHLSTAPSNTARFFFSAEQCSVRFYVCCNDTSPQFQ